MLGQTLHDLHKILVQASGSLVCSMAFTVASGPPQFTTISVKKQ